jgi:UDP:flavonoid glycosyltransferase YjiC (YdhE family)
VVVAVADAQHTRLAGLSTLPANVRLAQAELALHVVLPTCQALVQQGGAGTTMTALACAVPQLVLPQVSDQHFNAQRLAATGAGTHLPCEQATPEAIRDRVADLVGASHWAQAAQHMQRLIHARPSPAELVDALERLAS